MEINTGHFIIREADKDETEKISEQNYSGSVEKFLSSLTVDEISLVLRDAEAVNQFFTYLKDIANGNKIVYGAWQEEKMIGFISLVNEENSTPELQIEILPEFQNKGYGYEFLRVLLDWLFENKKYKYIRYTILPTNKASVALVEKIGGSLQTPKTEIEKLFIRIYHITKSSLNN